MAVTVRLFTFSEIITAPVSATSGRYSTDSVGLLKYPYLARQTISAGASATTANASLTSNNNCQLLQVQVDPGGVVHIELTARATDITEATTDSLYISGTQLFKIGPNWSISLLEASF